MVFTSWFNLLKPLLLVLQTHLVWQLCEFQPLGWNCHPSLHEQYLPVAQRPLKRCMYIEKSALVSKAAKCLQIHPFFCLIESQSFLNRSERSGTKSFEPPNSPGFVTITSNKYSSTGVCKVGFEGGRDFPCFWKFPLTWLHFNFNQLPPPDKYKTQVYLLHLCQTHTSAVPE